MALPGCTTKTDEASRAAAIVPTDAVAFVSVSLAPSLAQRTNLAAIGRRIPKAPAAMRSGFTAARRALLADLLKATCLDLRHDVEPWLGSEVAAAVLPSPAGSPPRQVVLVRVKNAVKARKALLVPLGGGCRQGGRAPATAHPFRIVAGFAVIGAGADIAADAAALAAVSAQAKAGRAGLAKAPAFVRLVGRLRGDRLVLGYATAHTGGGCDWPAALGLAGGIAFDLHAEPSAVVVDAVAGDAAGPRPAGRPRLTEALPAATTAALTLFDPAAAVRTFLDCTGERATVTGLLADQLGLDPDADILPWMAGEAVVVAGGRRSGTSMPDVGLVVPTSDHAAAAAALAKVKAAWVADGAEVVDLDVGGATGFTVAASAPGQRHDAAVLLADRLVAATSPDLLRALAAPAPAATTFGGTQTYRSALGRGAGDGTEMQLVVDVAALGDAVVAHLPPATRDRGRRVLEPVGRVGVRLVRQGGFTRLTVRAVLR